MDLQIRDAAFKATYDKKFGSYQFENDCPKNQLFVKLKPGISPERRAFVSNGIRSFFRDDQMLLVDVTSSVDAVNSSRVLFQMFVGLLGFIALTLAFYLLKVSTDQRINEHLWEYGQLRAMGLRKDQGMKIYLYEQYGVITASALLGLCGGFLLTWISTAQFLIYTENPFKLLIPWEVTITIIVVAALTTFRAVHVPITKVNRAQVAAILTGTVDRR